MSLSEEGLQEIEARAKSATEGPWEAGRDNVYARGLGRLTVADYLTADNATFIAHARTDVPALLAEVKRLRAGIEGIHRPERIYAPCVWLTCDNEECQESTRDGERFHADEPTGLVCWECLDEDGEPHEWPCPTAALLNPTEGEAHE